MHVRVRLRSPLPQEAEHTDQSDHWLSVPLQLGRSRQSSFCFRGPKQSPGPLQSLRRWRVASPHVAEQDDHEDHCPNVPWHLGRFAQCLTSFREPKPWQWPGPIHFRVRWWYPLPQVAEHSDQSDHSPSVPGQCSLKHCSLSLLSPSQK